jgi:uncharacterized membrane protein
MVATLETPISRRVAARTVRPGTSSDQTNVGELERVASAIGGGLLTLFGLSRGGLGGLGLAALGGSLVYRGLSGQCQLYHALGVNTAQSHGPATSVAARHGFKVEKATTINRPAEELFRFWRNFENLPRVMDHLQSVTVQGERSHWVAKAPLGMHVAWDAEIVNEKHNELIAWRSIAGSQVDCAGSVHFSPAPAGRGTEVRVTLKYDPPGGKLGGWFAWLFGEEPSVQVREDLRRFKQLMETGEIPTTVGQPSCRS